MKIQLLIAVFFLGLTACGQPGADAAVDLTGGWIPAPPPCASGFERVGSNYCRALTNTAYVQTLTGSQPTCTLTNLGASGLNGSVYVYQIALNVAASGTAGTLDTAGIESFDDDSTCATIHQIFNEDSILEFAASSGTIGKSSVQIQETGDSNGNFYYLTPQAPASTVTVSLIGYYQ